MLPHRAVGKIQVRNLRHMTMITPSFQRRVRQTVYQNDGKFERFQKFVKKAQNVFEEVLVVMCSFR